jgi:hypothetical protein
MYHTYGLGPGKTTTRLITTHPPSLSRQQNGSPTGHQYVLVYRVLHCGQDHKSTACRKLRDTHPQLNHCICFASPCKQSNAVYEYCWYCSGSSCWGDINHHEAPGRRHTGSLSPSHNQQPFHLVMACHTQGCSCSCYTYGSSPCSIWALAAQLQVNVS